MTRDELIDRQWRTFKAGLARVLPSNSFLRERFDQADVSLHALQSRDDLAKIPFITKAELLADQAANPPFGTNLSSPIQAYSRLHQTSGTSGRKLFWPDTPSNWSWFMTCWGTIYRAARIDKQDRLFFPFSFGPFIGFWAAFDAATHADLFCLAGGGLSTKARLQLLLDVECSIILCTPTYALRLAEVAGEAGVDLAASPIRALILAGEPGGAIPAVRQSIETSFGARVFDHYGMTEVGSIAAEWLELPGKSFLMEDQVIAEVLDPATHAPVAEGQVGELVLTNLGRWDSPLVRYRTGDLVRWRMDVSPPEAPFMYMDGGVLGRTDDMLWVKGNNVFPSSLEGLVREFPEVSEFQIEQTPGSSITSLLLRIEPLPAFATQVDLAGRIEKAVQDRFYFRPRVELVPPGVLPRFEMKSRRVKAPEA